jgi:peptide/nickel transport system ATP-binding protein
MQWRTRADAQMTAMAGPPGTAPVLSVAGLTSSFKTGGRYRAVVRGVGFDVMPGETLAVVGESGSGKSVTALSIMRLLPTYSSRIEGSVRLEGRELFALSKRAMREVRGKSVGMIFQEPMTSLNPVLTVGFQITEALRAHTNMSRRAADREAVALLERVRIPAAKARFDDYPHQFSGGMRQRVMIAMALAGKPKLLIADEPTTALDVTIQAQILDLIRELQSEQQMSVLFITHDMGVVAEIADRTVVMHDGEVVETGATPDLFAHPAKPYTKALLSAVPRLGSMAGHGRPMRFPVVDPTTGESKAPVETPDTVHANEPPLLEVRDLVTHFDIRSGAFGQVSGRIHAVEDVTLSLSAGETLALVGESGCGKSTLGRSIMRLVDPRSGSIMLDGEYIQKLDAQQLRRARKGMQMIFQDPFASLNPRQSVGTSIAEPMLIHGIARADAKRKVEDLLVRVGLDPIMARRYPHEFSGGQRQRICIARALALEPKLIVADEAVSSLDVSVKAQVINLMLDLQASLDIAYIFISHDIAVVERVAHRVAVMLLGEIVEIGPRGKVLGNPQHPYTRKLISAVPLPDPSQRNRRRNLAYEEIKNPIRPLDYVPVRKDVREVSPGHFVQMWSEYD